MRPEWQRVLAVERQPEREGAGPASLSLFEMEK